MQNDLNVLYHILFVQSYISVILFYFCIKMLTILAFYLFLKC